MFPEIKPGTANSTAGWTCAICGFWVGSGQTHYCPKTAQPFTTLDFTAGYTDEERLHRTLDSIKELLERIARKLGA